LASPANPLNILILYVLLATKCTWKWCTYRVLLSETFEENLVLLHIVNLVILTFTVDQMTIAFLEEEWEGLVGPWVVQALPHHLWLAADEDGKCLSQTT